MLNFNNWWIEKNKNAISFLLENFSFSSPERAPKIKKIVVSSAVNQVVTNKQCLNNTIECLERIVNQKVAVTKSKKSAFKMRKGSPMGCKVTLRRFKMKNFLFKLINLYVPRSRNFRGLSRDGFDKDGNYNFGVSDLTIFHEVPYNLTFKNQGLQINIVFNSNIISENKLYLEKLSFPFRKS
jgi:large subunit ribosomal protein L5